MPYKDLEKKRAYEKKRRESETYIKYQKKFRLERKDYAKKWKIKNKEYCDKKTKEWYFAHPWARNHGAAKNRCTNPRNPKYKTYGERGIKFNLKMEETKMLWERDKASQMKSPSIHRKNNDKNYEYSNCQFIEMSEHTRKTWLGRRHSDKSKKLMSKIKIKLNQLN